MVVGYGISGASRSDSCSRRLRDSAELRLFVLSRRVANCQPGTIDTYCQRIGGLLDFAKKPATEITKADIELYLISLKEKQRSPHYIKGIYRNLRVFFDWMVREEMLQRSPLHNIPVPKVSRRGKEFLSREDFDRLLAACPANDFRGARNIAWLWLLWTTGCRFDGLAKLKLKDLEWTENRISVVEKGDKHRYAPFTGDAQRAVYRYLKARKVFMGAKDNYQELWINEERRPLGKTGLQRIVRVLQDRSGVHYRDDHHIFRRTWLYRNAKNGVPLKMLQLVGGWSDLTTLDGYIRAMTSEDAVNQVDWQ